ncbi:MAG: alkane 1-monooxygenase [Dokdonella sp.]
MKRARHTGAPLDSNAAMHPRDLGFLLPFTHALLPAAALALLPLSVPIALAAWLPLVFTFGLVPLIDAVSGRQTGNWETAQQVADLEQRIYFRILTLLSLPVWLLTLAWCMHQFVVLDFGIAGSIGWILSTGVLGGVLAINPAHELVHKPGWLEPWCGGVLLASVGYHGFKIEHVRGHHVNVATPEDSSSARMGESAFAFVPRALWQNMRNAWRLEAGRLRQRGRSAWTWHNEMLAWTALWLTFATTAWLLSGVLGVLFFVAQGVIAAATLEVINYVEHYGLQRREIAPGRYERVTHLHSWNAPQRYTNWLLFNLQRHSDHHAQPRRRYQALLHHTDSPQLPAGYASMFVLALVPPLWRRIMDPRALTYRSTQVAN